MFSLFELKVKHLKGHSTNYELPGPFYKLQK